MKDASVISRISARAALAGGIAFSFLFTLLIWYAGEHWLGTWSLEPDRGPMWYYWQRSDATAGSRISAWGLYLLHNASIWYLIWRAQSSNLKYTAGLHPVNVAALGVTATFMVAHLFQTHLWYDGLAQDVPEWTSQWSVIFVLVGILLMENQRRGLVLGKKVDFVTDAARVVRKYHGYYFSWAIIYTYWYHPMEYTSGHLLGFAYMFLLLLQGSLFFTRMHVNKYWTLVQEISVVIHAVMVAVMNGDSWPMFLTGFLGVFVMTQMYGLPIPRRGRQLIGAAYVAMVIAVYLYWDPSRVIEVAAIPLTEWGCVLIVSGLILLGMRLFGRDRAAVG